MMAEQTDAPLHNHTMPQVRYMRIGHISSIIIIIRVINIIELFLHTISSAQQSKEVATIKYLPYKTWQIKPERLGNMFKMHRCVFSITRHLCF